MSKKGPIVAQTQDGLKTAAPGAAFREGFVEADGFRIRYMEAGQGTPLVHLHGAGGMRLTPGHDLLCPPSPGGRLRDAGFRLVAREHPDADDGGVGRDDGHRDQQSRHR